MEHHLFDDWTLNNNNIIEWIRSDSESSWRYSTSISDETLSSFSESFVLPLATHRCQWIEKKVNLFQLLVCLERNRLRTQQFSNSLSASSYTHLPHQLPNFSFAETLLITNPEHKTSIFQSVWRNVFNPFRLWNKNRFIIALGFFLLQ